MINSTSDSANLERPLIAEFESLIQSAIMCLPAKLPDVQDFLARRQIIPTAEQLLDLLRKETELRIRSDILSENPVRRPVVREIIVRFPELSGESRMELVILEWQLSRTLKRPLALAEYMEQLRDVVPSLELLRDRILEFESAFLRDAGVTAGPAFTAGQRVGSYRIVRRIGVGGMGEVYEAEEVTELHRRVALKVVRIGNSSPDIQRRFEAERQILAIMEHPNIAKVFAANSTDGGLPYFTMELVKGITLSDYVSRYRLGITDRLQLMIQICRAIHHVHQRGILHRDIKPSNILVTTEGAANQVKIIDFGVAKAISPTVRLMEDPANTVYGTVIGSFQYMSPEQAGTDIQDMDVRSDVYSLGVVLYELLTGTTPVSRKYIDENSRTAVIERIRTGEPLAPSVCIARFDVQVVQMPDSFSLRQISRQLKGDLDVITLKALEKERTRRYDSAAHLAEDLERYLKDDIVLATPPSASYRFRKLWNRQRLAIQAAGAVIIACLTAMIFMTRMWMLAQESQIAVQKALTDGLATSRAEAVPVVLESLASYSQQSMESLVAISKSNSLRARFRARCGLAVLKTDSQESVRMLITDWVQQPGLSDELYALITACRRHSPEAVDTLRKFFAQSVTVQEQARIAVILLLLDDVDTFRRVVGHKADLTLQTEIVQQIAGLRGYTQELCQYLLQEKDTAAVAVVVQGLAESQIRSRSWNTFDIDSETLRATLKTLVRDSHSALVVSSAGLALRRIGEDADAIIRTRAPIREFFVNSADMVMVRIPAGTFQMGVRPDAPIVAATGCVRGIVQTEITHDFFVADREVTIRAFRNYIDARRLSGQHSSTTGNEWSWVGPARREAPSEDHPTVFIKWDDAVEYCNWLSLQEGRAVCYQKNGHTENSDTAGSELVEWLLDPTASGYRLPTQAEWEYACRGETRTDQFFGTDRRQTANYAVYGISHLEPGRSRLPNQFGLFDMYGSVYEWGWDRPCQWQLDYTNRHLQLEANEYSDRPSLPPEALTGLPEYLIDPIGETRTTERGLRGGTFWLDEGSCLSGYIHPTSRTHGRDRGFGFRVVCMAGEN